MLMFGRLLRFLMIPNLRIFYFSCHCADAEHADPMSLQGQEQAGQRQGKSPDRVLSSPNTSSVAIN